MRWLLVFVCWLMSVACWGESGQDSLSVDTICKPHEVSKPRETLRDFDLQEDQWIEPQHYEFQVMGQITRTYESFTLKSNDQSITLSPDDQVKMGPYFGWRWLFLGYTFNIKNIGISKGGVKKEFDLSIYSPRVGVDLYYRRTGSDYKIRDVDFGEDIDGKILEGIPFAGVTVGITGVNAYYIFNHRRFSYPAAFAQSACQKVSCGSWMAGAGYTKNTLDLDYTKLQDALVSRTGQEIQLDSAMMFQSIKYSDFMFSGGYAYNWVFAKNFLFCASFQLGLAYKTSYGRVANEKRGFDFAKVNLDGIGRFGMVYNNTRWFVGWSAIIRTNRYRTSRFKANNIFGSLTAYVGYNFVLKKKYKKQKG